MTDRHAGYVITLEHDIRTDDAQDMITALKQIRGVLSVKPVVTTNLDLHIAFERAKRELSEKLWEALHS